ncbi:MAG: DUF2207 domain-containing protein, partial [Chloroflexota bacterium]
MRLAALLALAVALWLGAAGSPSVAQPSVAHAQDAGRSVQAPRYDVELAVQQGGDVLVTETLAIAFQGGPFRQGFRRIPLDRLEGIRDVRVEEVGQTNQTYRQGADAPYTFAISGATEGGGPGSGDLLIEWWFPPTTSATRTFVISYRALGVVRYYEGGDQLRWQVFGADRPYPVQQSTVTLRLPPDVEVPAGGWQVDAYPGRFTQGTSTGTAGTVTWQAANLPPNQPYEVRAQWPHGLVTGSPPAWQAAADAADWRNENLRPVLTLAFGAAGVLIPLFGGLALLVTWYSRGRDPRIGRVPPELDSPPSDLPPALVGTVVDEHADAQDVVATVLDLAARGIITIKEVHDPALGGSQRDFELELVQERPAGLHPYEQTVLDSFFSRGKQVRLSRLGEWFRYAIPSIQRALHREVAQVGLFAGDPEAARRRYRRLGTILIIAGIVLGLVACGAAPSYAGPVAWPFSGVALVGALLRFVAVRMPRRTAAGALEAARWRAYARHLSR